MQIQHDLAMDCREKELAFQSIIEEQKAKLDHLKKMHVSNKYANAQEVKSPSAYS